MPHTYTPLESGARSSVGHARPQHDVKSTSSDQQPDSQRSGGHLSQAISEHLACATGGAGRSTSAADASSEQHSANSHVHNSPADASTMTQSPHAAPAYANSGASSSNASAEVQERSMNPHAAPEDEAAAEHLGASEVPAAPSLFQPPLVHQKPSMDAPSRKRLKCAESASESSSSDLNPTDFGLASVPVWQSVPRASGLDNQQRQHDGRRTSHDQPPESAPTVA